jgi:hypothetical protein
MLSAKDDRMMDDQTGRLGQSSRTDQPREETGRAEDRHAKRRDQESDRKKSLDDALDAGLEDSFPASDLVAVTQPPHSARDKSDL